VTGVGYEPRGEFRLNGQAVRPAERPELQTCLACGVLCNGAQLVHEDGAWRIVGDPTEAALLAAAARRVSGRATWRSPCYVNELPFDSERKMMSVLRRDPDGGLTLYVKGAPDVASEPVRFGF